MAKTKKGKVLQQIQGYRIRQMKDGEKYTGKYGVYTGKYVTNEEKGFKTIEEAIELINKLISGELKKKRIKNSNRW